MTRKRPLRTRYALTAALALAMLMAATGAVEAAGSGDPRAAPARNGFALSNATVPVVEILGGGPPRDGIPPLTDPQVLPAAAAP